MATRTIRVDQLARVEGEGALDLFISDGRVSSAQLRIFEPPRLFEALLRGRSYAETPDIVARICGICPIAYQMGAVHAIEDAFGIEVGGQLRALRRLIYCGEWIESHALHVLMLHAPDFLGYPDAIAMSRDHGDRVRGGLALKKAGNDIIRVLGGREIHPVNVKAGGFYRLPTAAELAGLAESLKRASEIAVGLVRWVAGFPFPTFERDYEFVALRHPDEYPLNEGRLVSNRGLDVAIGNYDKEFEERQVAHSTALHTVLRRRGSYLVGPLARYALNFDQLPRSIQDLAHEAGLGPVCTNPFRSIVVRAIEIAYACEEALRIIAAYEPPPAASVPIEPRAGTGFGCTEAPRGICWHRYDIEADGSIRTARIVPPTSQNQPSIEEDLVLVAGQIVDQSDDVIRGRCEQSIRNYDPCISCSTHFLKLAVHRT
jgi:sulfhydrogenase subunit alpha